MRAKTVRDRSGYVQFGGSTDFHGYDRSKPRHFSSDEELVGLLRDNGAADEEGYISCKKAEGNHWNCFPVESWAEFTLDSMHQNGQNAVYGGPDDLYPFVDQDGFVGYVSKEKRPKDTEEAKKRLKTCW